MIEDKIYVPYFGTLFCIKASSIYFIIFILSKNFQSYVKADVYKDLNRTKKVSQEQLKLHLMPGFLLFTARNNRKKTIHMDSAERVYVKRKNHADIGRPRDYYLFYITVKPAARSTAAGRRHPETK